MPKKTRFSLGTGGLLAPFGRSVGFLRIKISSKIKNPNRRKRRVFSYPTWDFLIFVENGTHKIGGRRKRRGIKPNKEIKDFWDTKNAQHFFVFPLNFQQCLPPVKSKERMEFLDPRKQGFLWELVEYFYLTCVKIN